MVDVQNWGWTAIAPVIGGNVFNLLFGRIYDSNTVRHLPPGRGSCKFRPLNVRLVA